MKIAAIAGFSGVALGAFGAHGLKKVLSPELMSAYQTGVLYHLIHAVVLLVLSAWLFVHPTVWLQRSAVMMLLGLILFSGSLYALALTGERLLGMITPFGGVAWLVAWSFLLLAAIRLPEPKSFTSEK
ncbi:MAG: DUF423 domain-containing protein [Oleibacter sp.]|nr:DUF423 domain-containing protein [Thalassolituus sp.]